jgi:Putative Ig domain
VSISPLTISTSKLPQATAKASYTATLTATGGTSPYTWSMNSGRLPAGLSLANTGTISGTPSSSGNYSFGVRVTDSTSTTGRGRSNKTTAATVTLTVAAASAPVAPQALSITTSSLPSGAQGTAYSNSVVATGGTTPYAWSITSGSLPAGLSLSSSTGLISGTPTTSGTSSFTATVADAESPAQTKSVNLSIVVAPKAALAITTSSLPSGTQGVAYSVGLAANGGTTPYTWSIASPTGLPPGLALASSTGLISGTPTAAGTSSVTFKVADSSSPVQTKSVTLSVAVAAAQKSSALTIGATLPSGTVNTGYSNSMTATGGTPAYTWSIASGSLPPGLTLAATSGTISGTPTTSGTYNFTATVSDNSSPVQTASASTSIVVAAAVAPGPGTTWFVRPDGGTRYSSNVTAGLCDGQADVAYPGSGTNQHCAFNDVRYLWMDGTYGNSAWVISGGDTVVIRGCAALSSQQNPDAPHCRIGWDKATGNDSQNFWCAGVSAFWGCSMPPPPNGTASQHTRILGACAYGTYSCTPIDNNYPYTSNNLTQLFGGFGVGAVMYLSGSSYVDVEGLEITSHNGACTTLGSPVYPAGCSTSSPLSDFANWGVVFTNTTSNVTLQDLYIHGFTNLGIGGPIGGPITLTRVFSGFNAFAGWNFDDGSSTPDAPGSSITQSYVTMIGNGCLEEYPIVHTQFPALSCWDSSSGGFGDSWSGQNTELDSFTCDHCYIAYNTKDAAIGPHTLLKNLSVTNSSFVGNMGQQGKWGMEPNSATVFTNNLFVGNCNRMSQQLPGAAQNFNTSTGLNGSYLSNFCRAAGDVFDYFSDANSTVLFANNTIVTYSPTVFDFGCGTAGVCGTSPYVMKNNIFLGYTTSASYYPNSGQAPGLFYMAESSVSIASSYNIEFGVRNGDCSSGGTGIICSDPQLVSEPAQGTVPPESTLDNFNFYPATGSPAIGAGVAVPGVTTDYYGVTRPNPPTIGAVEPQ